MAKKLLLPLVRGSWGVARGPVDGLALSRTIAGTEFACRSCSTATIPSLTSTLYPSRHAVLQGTRHLSTTAARRASDNDGRVTVWFTDRDGDVQTVRAKLGDNLLEVAREYDIDLEGACDGTLSCSTCHLVVHPEWFPKISDPITEEEEDMLDLAYGLTDTSRLGCQVVVTEDLDGLKLTIPMATLDAREA
ncbi:2Fe-2S ferredoxin [Geodia barretti]|uniref:2Fe-2S ferredoxin n=1 Tax=Geodia barretti TaxID=519541 RepID=A0AA35TLZ3_GEOBA|nr:2Fe-2S ferredoxin [Geodia barretti]